MIVYVFFFFFQAEDGIRDKLVTGVQTCALPIFPDAIRRIVETCLEKEPGDRYQEYEDLIEDLEAWQQGQPPAHRSEERRVGKSVDLGGRRIIKKKRKNTTGMGECARE